MEMLEVRWTRIGINIPDNYANINADKHERRIGNIFR